MAEIGLAEVVSPEVWSNVLVLLPPHIGFPGVLEKFCMIDHFVLCDQYLVCLKKPRFPLGSDKARSDQARFLIAPV